MPMPKEPRLVEPSDCLSQTFRHVIPLLITRFEQWDILLVNHIAYFQHERDIADTLAKIYQEASKSLSQTTVKPSIINAMDTHETNGSSLTKAKVKLDKFTDTFNIMGRKWEFDYAPHGGVQKNLARMKDEADQCALLQIAWRDFILNDILLKLEKQREHVQKRAKELSEWQKEFEEAGDLRERCGNAWTQLMEATTIAKTTRDMTPLPQHDPALKFLQYHSLRESWIEKMNTLQMAAVIHQQTSKTVENTLIESLQSLFKTYLATKRTQIVKIKGLFSPHPTPFDAQEEWTHFSSRHNVIPTPALDRPLLPRQLRVLNDDHFLTKPAAVAMLVLEPLFPYSLKSSKTPRRYVVTHAGFLIKASENEMTDPIPRRGFKLSDSNIWVNHACGGKLSFVIKGTNCCRYGSVLSMASERRTSWKFTGRQAEVTAMIAVIAKKMPVLQYQCIPLH